MPMETQDRITATIISAEWVAGIYDGRTSLLLSLALECDEGHRYRSTTVWENERALTGHIEDFRGLLPQQEEMQTLYMGRLVGTRVTFVPIHHRNANGEALFSTFHNDTLRPAPGATR